jgi:azurin
MLGASSQTFPNQFMKKLILTLTAVASAPFALADQKVELTGNDQMQFSTRAFEVTTGEKVTLNLKHIGQLPAAAMGHNVVILKPGTALPAFAAKCATARDHGYIPQDDESKELIVAFTKMIGGGESDTITFTAPAPGSYPFICTFPGHFALMQGVMTVKAK